MPTRTAYYTNCIKDACATGFTKTLVCRDITAFVQECNMYSKSFGCAVEDWRVSHPCDAIDCLANATYSPSDGFCPEFCADSAGFNQNSGYCEAFASEGCYCNTGYVFDGDICVLQDQCDGCFADGIYRKSQQSYFTSSNCSTYCTCHGFGNTTCEEYNCGMNAECIVASGQYACECVEGTVRFGQECKVPCRNNEYQCLNGDCIPKQATCDHSIDCPSEIDQSEALCCDERGKQKFCPKDGYFKCPNGQYIKDTFVCDGSMDCTSGEDEAAERCDLYCSYDSTASDPKLVISEKRTSFPPGSNVTFECQSQHTLFGESVLTCKDGQWSSDIPECYKDCQDYDPPINGAWNHTGAFNHRDCISAVCDPGYKSKPEGGVFCCEDGKKNGNLPVCENEDNCLPDPCVYGECVDLANDYTCYCDAGFEGTNCENDINECNQANDCDANANCTNTVGNYTCTCKTGYSGDPYSSCTEQIFFPYGDSAGDDRLTRKNDYVRRDGKKYLDLVSETIRPSTGFPFGDNFYYSLYILDNGLIVFTNENGAKYTYPRPLASSYDNNQDWPLSVATFWADASIERTGVREGEVFYQVYQKTKILPDATVDAVLADASQRIRNTPGQAPSGVDFSATWMLVVTWVNLQPFGSRTYNTFQGAIATDGRYSFAIYNFQEDLMNWNVRALTDKQVIMGYNHELYKNIHTDNPPFSSVNDRFRPDENIGNTDLQGRWIYRLENNNEHTTNSKQICLDWYEEEEDPSQWVQKFDPCPCSYYQAWQDRRFYWSYRTYSVADKGVPPEWQGKMDPTFESRLSAPYYYYDDLCMQPTVPFPTWYFLTPFYRGWWWTWGLYKGYQCCYRYYDYSLITRYSSEFDVGVTERYMYHYSGERDDVYDKWFSKDLMPRHHCCTRSNDNFFCNLYLERRPAASCSGYRPPKLGWMYRDPHFKTLDGLPYTFNGLGEYTMVEFENTLDSGIDRYLDDKLYVLQARTKQGKDIDGAIGDFTVFEAFAAQYNGSYKVEIYLTDDDDDYELYVDGAFVDYRTEVNGTTYNSSDSFLFISYGAEERNISCSWGPLFSVTVEIVQGMMEIIFSATEELNTGISRGLLGVWDGNSTNDLQMFNGSLQTCSGSDGNCTDSEIYEFGETWKVLLSDSLFTLTTLGVSATYQPKFLDDLKSSADATLLQDVEDVCNTNMECLYDGLSCKDPEIGNATKVSGETLIENDRIKENFPPNVTAPDSLDFTVGQPTIYIISAEDPENDVVTFNLLDPIPANANINESSGVLTWTPTDRKNISMIIQAMDPTSAASTTEPIVRVCDCKNGGTCLWGTNTQDYNLQNDKFAIVLCDCAPGWAGVFCEEDYDACTDDPCYEGVLCVDELPPSMNATCGGGTCPGNLVGDGFKCSDLDECDVDAAAFPCDQICTNIVGGYECSCEIGYFLQSDGRSCTDIDECTDPANNTCDANGICINKLGGYSCICPDGFRGDGYICDQIDECSEGPFPCNESATCQDTDGAYICTCIPGYEGNGVDCADIDECDRQLSDCQPTLALCVNTPGSFACTCRDGYEGNGTLCSNIDECADGLYNCNEKATCMDSEGSYFCQCPMGTIFSADGLSCNDIDECTTGINNCAEGSSECINSYGNYSCQCLAGYEGNGIVCNDINECVNSTCLDYQDCSNTDGSYMCVCWPGFVQINGICFDDDECAIGIDDCNRNYGYCVNTPGSYECYCRPEYQGNGINCTDVDECANKTDDCEQNCANTFGSYICSCGYGYTVDPVVLELCLDIDECAFGLDECSQICNNTSPELDPKGYTCSCLEGFNITDDNITCIPAVPCNDPDLCTNGNCYYDGQEQCQCLTGYEESSPTVCIDFDECANETLNSCEDGCGNLNGTYECFCSTGYKLNPSNKRMCDDVNECLEGTDDCSSPSEVCINSIGGFQCRCAIGFVQNGSLCQDIDECSDQSDTCSSNADCTNDPGSFTCKCKTGFSGNGYDCQDVNECLDSSTCGTNTVCTNSIGSYSCSCENGYEGDPYSTCTDIEECALSGSCSKFATCNNTIGSYDCQCNSGYQGDGRTCIDVNECNLPTSDPDAANCSPYGVCTNLPSNFSCACLDGYLGDGFQCTDINECDANPCQSNSTCKNTDGSFTCECNAGYRGDGSSNCVDINECSENLDECDIQASCTNSEGNYTCQCLIGFTGDGRTCQDINECDGTNDCDLNAECQNTVGSYSCSCKVGFYTTPGSDTGKKCKDLNECLIGSSSCNEASEDCLDTIGSFECTCKEGFIKLTTDSPCTDVDECNDKPCEEFANARCLNLQGSYTCVCQTGYQNTSGQCEETSFETLTAEYDALGGVLTDSNLFGHDNLELYREVFMVDIGNLFMGSNISDSYTGVSITSMETKNSTNVLTVEIVSTLEFQPGTVPRDLKIEEVFLAGLTGKDKNILPPANRVVLSTLQVGNYVFDVCLEGKDDCGSNAICEFNVTGNYTCSCPDGFSGNAYEACIDNDECADSPCDIDEKCINIDGSYDCICDLDQGFVTDGESCQEYRTYSGSLGVIEYNGEVAVFIPAYNNSQSSQYAKLQDEVCYVVINTFQQTDVSDQFKYCFLTDVLPGTESPSVRAASVVGFYVIISVAFDTSLEANSSYIDAQFNEALQDESYFLNYTETSFLFGEDTVQFTYQSHPECYNYTCNGNEIDCIEGNKSLTCVCLPGYRGDYCEIPVTTTKPPAETKVPTSTGLEWYFIVLIVFAGASSGMFGTVLLILVCRSTSKTKKDTSDSYSSSDSRSVSEAREMNEMSMDNVGYSPYEAEARQAYAASRGPISPSIRGISYTQRRSYAPGMLQQEEGMSSYEPGRQSGMLQQEEGMSSYEPGRSRYDQQRSYLPRYPPIPETGLAGPEFENVPLDDESWENRETSDTSSVAEEKISHLARVLQRLPYLNDEMKRLSNSMGIRSASAESPPEYNQRGPYVVDGSESGRQVRGKKGKKPTTPRNDERPLKLPRVNLSPPPR